MKKRSFIDKAENYAAHTVLAMGIGLLFALQLLGWLMIKMGFSDIQPGTLFVFANVAGFSMFIKEMSEKVTDQWRVYKRFGWDAFTEAARQVFGVDLYSDPADRELELSRDPLWDWLIPYLVLNIIGLVLS